MDWPMRAIAQPNHRIPLFQFVRRNWTQLTNAHSDCQTMQRKEAIIVTHVNIIYFVWLLVVTVSKSHLRHNGQSPTEIWFAT